MTKSTKSNTQVGTIILAAGKGTRMYSNTPKVLHKVGGKHILQHIIETSENIGCEEPILIYGFAGDTLKNTINNDKINWVKQTEQLGTGHAVKQSIPFLKDDKTYIILLGDAPLIEAKTLNKMIKSCQENDVSILTVSVANPFGYGRIIKNSNGFVDKITEEKDATEIEKKVREINSGVFALKGCLIKELVNEIKNNNNQQEYYFTDIVEIANTKNLKVVTVSASSADEILGCNDKTQLAELETIYRKQQANELLKQGVTLIDPARIDIRGNLSCGKDVEIDINTIFEGTVKLGNNVKIGANCIIKNSKIEDGAIIDANSIIESSEIGQKAMIGPFARIRPKTKMLEGAKAGNFVELKNATIGKGSKVNHLSYVGDAILGQNVNIGAGTITCNYDGANKHITNLGDDVFIGSNSALVAPVTIGKGATIGAGSTITKKVDENNLALTRAKQISISDWARPTKK